MPRNPSSLAFEEPYRIDSPSSPVSSTSVFSINFSKTFFNYKRFTEHTAKGSSGQEERSRPHPGGSGLSSFFKGTGLGLPSLRPPSLGSHRAHKGLKHSGVGWLLIGPLEVNKSSFLYRTASSSTPPHPDLCQADNEDLIFCNCLVLSRGNIRALPGTVIHQGFSGPVDWNQRALLVISPRCNLSQPSSTAWHVLTLIVSLSFTVLLWVKSKTFRGTASSASLSLHARI